MTHVTGTGKYEQLLERCRSLGADSDRGGPSLRGIGAGRAHGGGGQGTDHRRSWSAPRRRSPRSPGPRASTSGNTRIVDVPHSHAAAAKAVELVRQGEAELLMKGSLHTDEIARRGGGARDRPAHRPPAQPRLHHGRPHLPQGADRHRCAPSTSRRRSRTRSTSARTRSTWRMSLGVAQPKVAILAAVETVTSKMPATIDAACLCKMAERGQIKGGLLDGPLAFDNAISREAARIKGITSEVAGDPDILLAPDLEAGNILAKQLTFLANADSAGLVLGARVPIILTSRADSVRVAHRQLRGRDDGGPCQRVSRRVCGDGRLRPRPQCRLLEPEVLRLSQARGPDRGRSRRVARSMASGPRRDSRPRTAAAPSLASETLDDERRATSRRALDAAGRLAARPLCRRARARRRPPRRARRRDVRARRSSSPLT